MDGNFASSFKGKSLKLNDQMILDDEDVELSYDKLKRYIEQNHPTKTIEG